MEEEIVIPVKNLNSSLALALALLTGCGGWLPLSAGQAVVYDPHPTVAADPRAGAYAQPQTAGLPWSTRVVTRSGGVYVRYAPVPNRFFHASPGAADVRTAGESIARSDAAGVASAAPDAPTNGGQGQQGPAATPPGPSGTPSTTQQQINAIADELQMQHERLCREEQRHGRDCTRPTR